MASSVEQQIRSAAERNSQLLETLARTDGAASALAEHKRFQQDLQDQLDQSTQRIAKLEGERQKRLGEHEKYRDSHVRRFMFKASGRKDKFAQRAEDGEREYFKALQDAQQEHGIHAAITAQIEEAQRAEPGRQADADRHAAAQQELDALYARIFDGPTPQFPEEDAREQRYATALHAHQRTRALFDAETQAVEQLNRADRAMTQALREMEQALGYSRMDMFGGGAMADMMERSHLSNADRLAAVARGHAERAQRASPRVRDLPEVRINHGSIVSDVFFDNIVTDYAFHQEIRRGQLELVRCYNCLQDLGSSSDRRRRDLQAQLARQEQELRTARADLQRAREEVFQSVMRRGEAGSGGGGGGGGGGGDVGRAGTAEAPRRVDSLPPAYETAVQGDAAPAYDG
ncbi:hypothetical protein V2A60_000782 [Cordyceps javanica]|uniref:Uncharacterized protein n=1 Tax=Cordyceps javanica TaxID=43265 RepID=A0A545VZT7_9HYPO|nr:hypothetical protein IF1G_05427 [Cordyceps javanica]TQW07199.1 hypothetical protein IF2G_05583 [Cordyceps javanica]